MILGIIRHGQTDYNKNGMIQGQSDIPLNDTGKYQAQQVAMFLNNEDPHWDVLGSSDLSRSIETATIISQMLNIDISLIDQRLSERNFGPYEGTKIVDNTPKLYDSDFNLEGCENNDQLLNRVKDCIFELAKKYPDKKVLLVSHNHVIKSLFILTGAIQYNFQNHYINNSEIFYFDVNGDTICQIVK